MTITLRMSAGQRSRTDRRTRGCWGTVLIRPRWAALCLGGALVLGAGSVMAADAVVIALSGSVTAEHVMPGGSVESRPLHARTQVSQGELVRTGRDGRAQLRFSDGGLVSLQPSTEFRIDEYRFDADSQRALFTLLRGALRTATGAVGKRDRNDYRLRTPTATVGIRGTEYLAEQTVCDPICSPGPVAGLRVSVTYGLIEVATPIASLDVRAGQSAQVTRPDSAPRFTATGPVLAPHSLNQNGNKTNSAGTESKKASAQKSEGKDSGEKVANETTSEGTAGSETAEGKTSTTSDTNTRKTAAHDTSTHETANGDAMTHEAGAGETRAGNTAQRAASTATATPVAMTDTAIGHTNSASSAGASQTVDPAASNHAPSETGSAAGLPSNSGRQDNNPTGLPLVFAQAPAPSVDESLSSNIGRDPQGGPIARPATEPTPEAGAGTSTGTGDGATSEPAPDSTGSPGPGGGDSTGNSEAGNGNNADPGNAGNVAAGGGSGDVPPVVPHAVLGETGTIGQEVNLSVAGIPRAVLPSRDFQPGGAYRLIDENGVATLQSVGTGCPEINCASRGTARVAEAGSNAYAAWGRWTDGTVIQSLLDLPPTASLGRNQGIHYVIGVPSATVPTQGVFGYTLVGATSPTLSNGSIAPGSFEGRAAVQFDSVQAPRIGIDGLVTFAGGTPNQGSLGFATVGGAENPEQSSISAGPRFGFTDHSIPVVQSGADPAACSAAGCTVNLNGGLFGPNAEQLGFTYSIGSNRNTGHTVDGAAVFGKPVIRP